MTKVLVGEPEAVDVSRRVVAYLRVSTREQAELGAGLAAQRAQIESEAARRGWAPLAVRVDAGVSGKTMARPGLQAALNDVAGAPNSILVVSKLDRLSRSVADFAALLDQARRQGWGLVALDLGVDTTTPAGELVANVMAAVAQWERRTISQWTKDGLAAKKAEGVVLGRPAATSAYAISTIKQMREEGHSYARIAKVLNEAGVETAHGGSQWWPSSVRAVCSRFPSLSSVSQASTS